MAFDPDEQVTLTDHGTMKLRSAIARAMLLLPDERERATIVLENQIILRFEQIASLATHWEERLVPND
jgi:hypothetical protein